MKHITVEQMYTISIMKRNDFTQEWIAKAIGKNKSTISRELSRNCDGRNGKNAEDLTQKAIEILNPYKNWMHTITADNGKEFAEHKTIANSIHVDFFFARPYHSWERGANENTNFLIRQYFPKGSSFGNVSDDDVQRVQDILNNRPGKKSKFLTPNEFLSINLSNQKVAFVT